jgi:hypothetical protein
LVHQLEEEVIYSKKANVCNWYMAIEPGMPRIEFLTKPHQVRPKRVFSQKLGKYGVFKELRGLHSNVWSLDGL